MSPQTGELQLPEESFVWMELRGRRRPSEEFSSNGSRLAGPSHLKPKSHSALRSRVPIMSSVSQGGSNERVVEFLSVNVLTSSCIPCFVPVVLGPCHAHGPDRQAWSQCSSDCSPGRLPWPAEHCLTLAS